METESAQRERIHKLIDKLSPEGLEQLSKFIELVKSVEDMPEKEADRILDEAIKRIRYEQI